MISVPANCPIPMCCIEKDGSCEYVVICSVKVYNATFNNTSVISWRSVDKQSKNTLSFFPLAIILSVFLYRASEYPIDIFKLFLHYQSVHC
jgi:hypothetical protein